MPILLLSRVLWRLFFISTVSVALLLLTLVLASVYVQTLQPQLENWASQHLQQPVRIGAVQVLWFEGMPRLQLYDIRLPTPATELTDVHIKQMQITLDWWQSLRSRHWQMQSIAVQTQQLTLWRQADNHLVLVGLHQTADASPSDPAAGAAASGQWLRWLRQQPQVHLSIAQLTWLEPNGEAWQFAQVRLELNRRTAEEHSLQLHAALPHTLPYLQSGVLYFNGLTHWQDTQLLDLRGQLQLKNAYFTPPDQQHYPLTLRTNLTAHPLSNEYANAPQSAWRVQLNQLQLNLAQQTWLPTQLSLDFIPLATGSYRFQAHLQHLAFNQLLPWVAHWGQAAAWHDYLAQLQGSVRNLTAMYQTAEQWSISGELHQVQHRPHGWWPGLENLNAHWQLGPDGGTIDLTQADVRWHPPELAHQAFTLQQLSGTVAWQRQAQGWRIHSTGLQSHLLERLVQVQGWLTVGPRGTDSDIQLQLARLPLTEVYRYVPDIKVGQTARWLEQSLVGGSLSAITAKLRGPVQDWFRPDAHAGFHAHAQINAGQLKFHPAWPQINAIQADLSVHGQRLTVTAQQARLYQHTQAQQVTAEIAQLGEEHPLLTVQVAANSTLAEGLRLLRETPLHKTINPDTDLPQLSGLVALELQLSIPLGPTEHRVQGALYLKQARLHQADLNIALEALQGPVRFDSEQLSGELTGTWHGQPVQLALQTTLGQSDSSSPVHVQLSGQADVAFIQQQLQQFAPLVLRWPWLKQLSGKTTWQVQLTLPTRRQKTHGAATQVALTTDLRGIAIDLPAPLAKAAATAQPLRLTLHLPSANRAPTQIQLHYDAVFSIALTLNQSTVQGRLVLGGAMATPPSAPGWAISGGLTQLDPLAWWTWWRNQPATAAVDTPPVAEALPPITLDLSLANLPLPWLPLDKLQLRLQQAAGLWTAQFDSPRLTGRLRYQKPQGIQVRLQQLHLTEPPAAAPSTTPLTPQHMTPQAWPALLVIAEQVQLDDYTLGEVRLLTEPTARGMRLKQLAVTAPNVAVTAHGEWQVTDQGEHSTLVVQGVSENVGQLLRNYGFDTAPIQAGHLEWLLDVVWPEGFFAISLERLVGSFSLLLTKGQLVDIEPGAVGRVIGLFDLQALPRRLAMDFSDVFEEGLSFEIIAGDFALSDGYAETDNLILQASAARVEIKGRTGLVNRTYEQEVIVTPHLSNTLPLAGVIAGGLSAGAVTLIVHQLLQTQIEKAMQYRYRITGSWDAPTIEALKTVEPMP